MHLLHINTLTTHEKFYMTNHMWVVFMHLLATLTWLCCAPCAFTVARMTDGFHLNGAKTKKDKLHLVYLFIIRSEH